MKTPIGDQHLFFSKIFSVTIDQNRDIFGRLQASKVKLCIFITNLKYNSIYETFAKPGMILQQSSYFDL